MNCLVDLFLLGPLYLLFLPKLLSYYTPTTEAGGWAGMRFLHCGAMVK
jgi:hypothetical protein